MAEVWRPIKGYEGVYEVSNTCKARSIDRHDRRGVFHKGVELKIRMYEDEQFIRLTTNGQSKDRSLDRIFCTTFTEGERLV